MLLSGDITHSYQVEHHTQTFDQVILCFEAEHEQNACWGGMGREIWMLNEKWKRNPCMQLVERYFFPLTGISIFAGTTWIWSISEHVWEGNKKWINFRPCPCQVPESTYENKLQLGNSMFSEDITAVHGAESPTKDEIISSWQRYRHWRKVWGNLHRELNFRHLVYF